MRRVVVLPEPLGPRKPVTAPVRTVKDRSSTAVTGPKCFVSPSTVIAAVLMPSTIERDPVGRVRHNRPVRPSPHRSAARPLVAAALACVLLAGCGGGDTSDQDQASDTNVFAERAQTLVEKPRLEAAAKQAAADGDAQEASALERLARTPTGIWLTPEAYGADQVSAYVTEVVAATEALTVPLFVLYGIPDRDCTGGFSAGGLTADTYLPWVQAIAGALADAGTDTAAVLEPDALAGSVACGPTDRMSLLRQALQTLVTAGVTTYVDAGHSDWIPASEMAPLLEKVGVLSLIHI